MKNLLLTSAVALLSAAPLAAQTDPAPSPDAPASQGTMFVTSQAEDDILGSDLIGMDVESSQAEYDDTMAVSSTDRGEWDDIGEINDVLISPDGTVKGVLVDIGGFLGMGERTVALDMSRVHLLTDDAGTRFAAVNSSQEELEQAPEFMPTDPPAATMSQTTDGVTAPGVTGTTGMAAGDMTTPARPANVREGFTDVDYATFTAEQLEGASVYGAGDEDVGDVGALVLSPDGRISQAVIDVGGFLGIGTRSVAIPFEQMQVMQNDAGDIRVYIDAAKDTLEAMPEYES